MCVAKQFFKIPIRGFSRAYLDIRLKSMFYFNVKIWRQDYIISIFKIDYDICSQTIIKRKY